MSSSNLNLLDNQQNSQTAASNSNPTAALGTQSELLNFLQNNPLQSGITGLDSLGSVSNEDKNAAYAYEYLRQQVATVFRNSQIFGKEVADYAQFMDPANVPYGAAILQEVLPLQQISVDGRTLSAKAGFDLNAYEVTFYSDPGRTGPTLPTAVPVPVVAIDNKITGNSMVIDGDKVSTVVDGEVTSSTSLATLFGISGDKDTGSIMLENGAKLTFVFDTTDANNPKLSQVYMTHPDGSYGIVSNLSSSTAAFQVQHSTPSDPNGAAVDALMKDGPTFFMDPTGAALQFLNPETGNFQAVFGDPRAKASSLNSFSFGGNLYNFFLSQQDGEWKAQQLISQRNPPPLGGPGGPGGIGIGGPPNGSDPTGPVAPINWQSLGSQSIEELLTSDMTGIDPDGTKRVALAKQLLQNPGIDFQTKLFLLLFVFLDKNGKDVNQIFQQLAGVDMNGNPVNSSTSGAVQNNDINSNAGAVFGTAASIYGSSTQSSALSNPFAFYGIPTTGSSTLVANSTTTSTSTSTTDGSQYTYPLSDAGKAYMDSLPINQRMQFISNLQPKDPSQMGGYQTWANAQEQATQTDQSILQVRLTTLIQDRERFIDTVSNSMKAIDDALENTTRRIV